MPPFKPTPEDIKRMLKVSAEGDDIPHFVAADALEYIEQLERKVANALECLKTISVEAELCNYTYFESQADEALGILGFEWEKVNEDGQ